MSRADGLEVLKELPPSGHTLLLLGSRSGMTPGQARRLLQWSEQGGHLVLIAERLWDEDEKKSGDLLLDSLDIRQYLTEDFDDSQDRASEETADADADADEGSVDDHATEAPPEDTAGEEEEPADSVPDYSALTRLYLENERSPAYIGFDPDYHLYDPQNHAPTPGPTAATPPTCCRCSTARAWSRCSPTPGSGRTATSSSTTTPGCSGT